MAHEVGHVFHRHLMELFTRNAGIAALVGFVLGDVTGGVVITALAHRLLTASYTRDFERAADTTAVELLNAHDIDGRPLVDFFAGLHAKHGAVEDLLGPFATHPLSAERAAAISDRVTGRGPALSPLQWDALRAICD